MYPWLSGRLVLALSPHNHLTCLYVAVVINILGWLNVKKIVTGLDGLGTTLIPWGLSSKVGSIPIVTTIITNASDSSTILVSREN